MVLVIFTFFSKNERFLSFLLTFMVFSQEAKILLASLAVAHLRRRAWSQLLSLNRQFSAIL